MINAVEYIKVETEEAITGLHMQVVRCAEHGEHEEMLTLLEMAANLSSLSIRLVLNEATQDEHDLWETIIDDTRGKM